MPVWVRFLLVDVVVAAGVVAAQTQRAAASDGTDLGFGFDLGRGSRVPMDLRRGAAGVPISPTASLTSRSESGHSPLRQLIVPSPQKNASTRAARI